MSSTETVFNKKERIQIFDNSKKNNPNHSPSMFLCAICGKRHSWSELGKKH